MSDFVTERIICKFASNSRPSNMRYFNITNPDSTINFRDAVTNCIADDGSMYLPCSFTKIPQAFINNMPDMNLREIAYVTSNVFIGDKIEPEAVKRIVDYAFPVELPLIELASRRFVLELFHGPTMSFKDMGVNFLAGVMQYFNRRDRRKINVLVSSTGNTAAAVANAFGGVKDAEVFILYPKNAMAKISLPAFKPEMSNIHIVEVGGNIDDCKRIILETLIDKQLNDRLIMTSANSVNIARIIAQVAIFYYAGAQLKRLGIDLSKTDFALPSGNLSMITAGIFAKMTGLKCGSLIAACNANKGFDAYLKQGALNDEAPCCTVARFIDTAHPSNLPRIKALYNNDIEAMRIDLSSASIDDDKIAKTIISTIESSGYVVDPHTAVGLASLDLRLDQTAPAVVFATAHPLRSAEYLSEITGKNIEQNQQSKRFDYKTWKRVFLPPTFPALRKYILSCQ